MGAGDLVLPAGSKVSINSTSEEVVNSIYELDQFKSKRVSINSTSEEVVNQRRLG